MRSQRHDENAEFLLDWILVETSSEEIGLDYVGLMKWDGQAMLADASGEAGTCSILFIDMEEQLINCSSTWSLRLGWMSKGSD